MMTRLAACTVALLFLVASVGTTPAVDAQTQGQKSKEVKKGDKKAGKKSAGKRLDPVDVIHRHLRAILRMVKNGKKQNPKQCARIVKRVVSYAKRHRAALRAARRASQNLTARQRKRMNRRAQQLYNSLFSTYGEAVVELGQNCHGALHQIEHVIDGLMQLKPPGKGQSTGHDHHHHDHGHHDQATGH